MVTVGPRPHRADAFALQRGLFLAHMRAYGVAVGLARTVAYIIEI